MIKYKIHAINLLLIILSSQLGTPSAYGEETLVAVAANFTATAKDIATAFEAETGYKAVLSFGSTGKLYAQIDNGAPYDVFLAADVKRPARVEADGLAVAGSRFTYAKGKIVLYSVDSTLVDAAGTVLNKPTSFTNIAIANPKTAPYGAAAVEAMIAMQVYDGIKSKIVRGDNIAQTHQFIVSGNAQIGFVALSQVISDKKSSVWIVPNNLYTPIRQDAVLLVHGANNSAAQAFLVFLKSSTARKIIAAYGYGLD